MQTIIYRIADGVILGVATERRTEEDHQKQVEAEFGDILNNPRLGGTREDYSTVEVGQTFFEGMVASIKNGRLIQTPEIPEPRRGTT